MNDQDIYEAAANWLRTYTNIDPTGMTRQDIRIAMGKFYSGGWVTFAWAFSY